MSYQIIVDTDHLLSVSKKIEETSNDILNSITSLQKICEDLTSAMSDKEIKIKFESYLKELNKITYFYRDIVNSINDMSKEYDDSDNNYAKIIKNIANTKGKIITQEGGSVNG